MPHDIMDRHATGLIRTGGAADPIGIVDELRRRRQRFDRATRGMSDAQRRRLNGLPPLGPETPKTLDATPPPEPPETNEIWARQIAEAIELQRKALDAFIATLPTVLPTVLPTGPYDRDRVRRHHTATVDRIVDTVAAMHGVHPYDIRGSSRTRRTVLARRMVMVLAMRLPAMSLTNVGQLLDRDHTTVLHAQSVHARILEIASGKRKPGTDRRKRENGRNSSDPERNADAARLYADQFAACERMLGLQIGGDDALHTG